MPGDKKHHTDKFRRCVEQVVGKGHAESAAYAICTTSMQNAGEEVFEALESPQTGEERTLHLLGSTGLVRKETLNDRSYLVVPIIALMEGVIHAVNADTPEFVSGDVLKRAASSWIGKPVTLGHPAKAGKQCSASDSEVRKASGIGVIMKSEFDGRRLAQEAWIDEEKAKALHPRMYAALEAGGTEEVSVGAHVVTSSNASSFNGKLYKGTWLEASGDHLAFLPGGRGACSCEMGCGTFRAASHVVTEEGIMPIVAESFVTLEGKSLDERISMVQQAVDKWNTKSSQPMVTASNYAYARQVFDDRVIIDVGGKSFSVPYTVSGSEVKFDGEPTEVKQAWVALGGKGSGNFGHSGRPGEVGGSSSEGGGSSSDSPASGKGKLYAEREGKRKLVGDMDPYEAVSRADNDEKWPEAHEAVFVDSAGKEWMYTDKWEATKESSSDGSSGKTFVAGDKVTIRDNHWDRSVHGQTGRVHSVTTSAEGQPTAYVKLPTRGQWVHMSELDHADPTEKKPRDLEDRIKFEGGKYSVYGTGNLRLAAHLTRDAAERHLEAIDKILSA